MESRQYKEDYNAQYRSFNMSGKFLFNPRITGALSLLAHIPNPQRPRPLPDNGAGAAFPPLANPPRPGRPSQRPLQSSSAYGPQSFQPPLNIQPPPNIQPPIRPYAYSPARPSSGGRPQPSHPSDSAIQLPARPFIYSPSRPYPGNRPQAPLSSNSNIHIQPPRPAPNKLSRNYFPSQPLPIGKYLRNRPLHYDRYILWKGEGNRELIITSHGERETVTDLIYPGQVAENIVPAGTSLYFYGPDCAVLAIVDVDHFFMRTGIARRPYEKIRGGEGYPDYRLSKFQGPAYPEGRAYERSEYRDPDAFYGRRISPGSRELIGESYAQVRDCLTRYDVVTIEKSSASLYNHVLLSDLIADLISKGHRYSKIHCSFCRSIRQDLIAQDPALARFERPVYYA